MGHSRRVKLPLIALVCSSLIAASTLAEPEVVNTTPKLENLNAQLAANAEDTQALSNRAYVFALLGRKEEARADLKKMVTLKDSGPMHNRAGWAYFNLGDYADAEREFELASSLGARQILFWEADYIDDRANAAELKKAMSARSKTPKN